MQENILNTSDYEIINGLINLSKSIRKIYKKLRNIECKKGKDNDDYNYYLNFLKMVLDYEKTIYDKISLKSKKEYIKYLENTTNCRSFNDISDILLENHYNMPVFRVISILKRNSNLSEFSFVQNLDVLNDKTKADFLKLIAYSKSRMSKLQTDNIRSFLNVLNGTENKKLITYIKYKVSYLVKDIEEEFLSNCFNIDEQSSVIPTNYYKSQTDINVMEQKQFQDFKQQFIRQLNYILKYSDFSLRSEYKRNDIILRICYLKGMLLLLDEKLVYEIKTIFDEYTNSAKKEKEYKHCKQLLCLLDDCFNLQNEDKENSKNFIKKL